MSAATLDAWQSRVQWSTLFDPKPVRTSFWKRYASSLVPTLAAVGILLNISQYAPLKSRASEEDEYEEGWQGANRAAQRRERRRRAQVVARPRYG